jgi:hypothetical protein
LKIRLFGALSLFSMVASAAPAVRSDMLVSTAWLAEHLNNPNVVSWAGQGFELWRFLTNTEAKARCFSASQPTAKRDSSKIWRKAGGSNAYVPKDSGLADQRDTYKG